MYVKPNYVCNNKEENCGLVIILFHVKHNIQVPTGTFFK